MAICGYEAVHDQRAIIDRRALADRLRGLKLGSSKAAKRQPPFAVRSNMAVPKSPSA